MHNPWLKIPAADYKTHMEHENVQQDKLIREHFIKCLHQFEPKSVLYLGAGMGYGLEDECAQKLSDILAVDINPEYLERLKKQNDGLTVLRTQCCSFPEEFDDQNQFDMVYGALFFEYVDLEKALFSIAEHLTPKGRLVALLQQPSDQGQMTTTGVTSIKAILPIMTLHAPDTLIKTAYRIGKLNHIFTNYIVSSCGKPFCETILQKT